MGEVPLFIPPTLLSSHARRTRLRNKSRPVKQLASLSLSLSLSHTHTRTHKHSLFLSLSHTHTHILLFSFFLFLSLSLSLALSSSSSSSSSLFPRQVHLIEIPRYCGGVPTRIGTPPRPPRALPSIASPLPLFLRIRGSRPFRCTRHVAPCLLPKNPLRFQVLPRMKVIVTRNHDKSLGV